MALISEDIKVGHWYEAKRLRICMDARPNNDRYVVWIGKPGTSGETEVQYDSDTVSNGRHLPKVTMEQFLKWAKREISEEEHESRILFKKKQAEKEIQ